jgi:hypothetical protein
MDYFEQQNHVPPQVKKLIKVSTTSRGVKRSLENNFTFSYLTEKIHFWRLLFRDKCEKVIRQTYKILPQALFRFE